METRISGEKDGMLTYSMTALLVELQFRVFSMAIPPDPLRPAEIQLHRVRIRAGHLYTWTAHLNGSIDGDVHIQLFPNAA